MTSPSPARPTASPRGHSRLQEELVITGEAVALEIRPASVVVRTLGALIDAVAIGGGAALATVAALRVLGGLNPAQQGVLQVGVIALVTVGVPTVVETLTRGRSLG
ncbi:RDD family protein, partial [Georgenia sp. 10Sc9-8]|nr:RDD family protein [Georgenia halotolerans]